MNPADFLFTFLGTLTGGLITDMQTLLLAFVAIGFLNFGAQILIGKLESAASSRSLGQAQTFFELRNTSEKGSFTYEYYNSMYRAEMSKALSYRQKPGRSFGADVYMVGGSSGSSEESNFLNGSLHADLDALNADFQSKSQVFSNSLSKEPSLEEAFPELIDNSSPPADFGPPPEYYDSMPEYSGPPPDDEYYGPY